jgi:D-amino-acid dehydrogenase
MNTPNLGETPSSTSSRPDVLVIGAGVIGMAAAYELSLRGARVTVIDRGEPGMGCSYGNAGWITPCFAMPLPMPGMMLKSMKWLTNPDSPLYIKPEPSLLLLRWLWRFMLSMNTKQMLQSVDALTEISKYSLEAYARLDKESNGSFGFERKGLLMIGETDAGVEAARIEMELVARNGIPGKLMDGAAIRAFEPALKGPVKGGVYFPDEAHAEPLAVVRALADAAVKLGARILPRTEVFDFYEERGRLTGVRTTRGDLRADKYVLATGSWSVPIARRLGINIPILGGKGYAVILPPIDPMPRVPIMIVERKIAVTPRKDSLRLAGTLELVDRDEGITPRRVDAILNGAKGVLNVPAQPEIREVWRGLRPCTPDGVPVIGSPRRLSNLTVVTGHQMLGLQSAPGSGRLAADLVLGEKPLFDPHPFRATRF